MACPPILYQLAVAPSGMWRARVFNLPDQSKEQAKLPFLLALNAGHVAQDRDWQKDPGGNLSVLRLMGTDRVGLEKLLRLLSAHGIVLASAFVPVGKRHQPGHEPATSL